MGIVGSPRGLNKVVLPRKSKKAVLVQFNNECDLVEDSYCLCFGDLHERLIRYMAGEPLDFPDDLDLEKATLFQQRVWRMVQTIPYGQTRSYSWVANQLGCRAYRAVGQALGKNPVPIVVPCHRVIRSDGSLGGFTGGLDIKKHLLYLETTDKSESLPAI